MKLKLRNLRRSVPCSVFRHSIVLMGLLLGVLSMSHAQVRSFKHFGLDKSTFPSRIECIAQAPGGELLIGTLTGLVIYNGYTFETLTDQDGLAESAVSSITVTGDRIWIGHWAGSGSVMNAELGIIDILDVQEELSYHSVTAIWPLQEGGQLIATDGSGLNLYDGQTIEKILLPNAAEAANVKQVFALDGALIAVTGSGIYRCDDQSDIGRWQRVFNSSMRLNAAQFIDDQWYLGSDEGAFMASGEFDRLRNLGQAGHDSLENILAIAQDAQGGIWFASERQGIMLFDPATQKIDFLKREQGLSYDRVSDLLSDREGTMWVATAAGLDQHLGSAFELFDYRTGLRDNLTWDFVPIAANRLLVASSVGLQELELTEDWSGVVESFSIPAPFSGVRNMLLDQRGSLWLITDQGQLWRRSGEEFTQVALGGNLAMSLAEFEGNIWVGTVNGLVRLTNGVVSGRYGPSEGLGGEEINGLFPNPEGTELWITSLGGGVTLLREERFKQYGESSGMNSKVIHDIAFDSEGNAWLATYDRGVLRFADESFQQVSDSININCFAITIDDQNRIWVGHNWGVDTYDPEQGKVTNYTSDDGFMGIEVNPGAITFDPEGHLWMGTIMGLLRFTPSKARHNAVPPTFRVKQIRLGNNFVPLGAEVSTGQGSSDLYVDYDAISLANPALNTVRYRLNGLHDHWKTLTENRPIEYSSLPAGDFVLEVVACNAQQCSNEVVTLSVEVVPAFYTRWWFYTILFLMALSAVFMLDRYRNTEIADQRAILEDRLASRSQELEDIRHERKELKFSQTQSELFAASIIRDQSAAPENMSRFVDSFSAASSKKPGLGSDHAVYFELGSYKVIGLVDFGVPNLIGAMSYQKWKRSLDKELLERHIVSREGFQRAWQRSLQQVGKTLSDTGKVKTIQSAFIILSDDDASFYSDGLPLLVIQDGVKGAVVHSPDAQGNYRDLMKSGELFYALPKQSQVITFSDGLINQLNEEGTKNYSVSRLTRKIQQAAKEHERLTADQILDDLNEWRGIIELFDDVFIVTFRYA